MSADRAAEIIAAYGADAERWPGGERAAALAVIAGTPRLAALRAEAEALDRVIGGWAEAAVAPGDAAQFAAVALAVAQPARRHGLRWVMAGSLAAALVAVVAGPGPAPTPHRQAPAVATVSDDQAFAMVFTPTVDEDGAI